MIRPSLLYRAGTLAIALVLLAAIATIAELGQSGQKTINAQIRVAQERQVVLAQLLGVLADAETAQRGFLLTREEKYLRPYQAARDRAEPTLDRLSDLFREGDQPMSAVQLDASRHLRVLVGAKLGELAASIALYSTQGAEQAVALVRTDIGDTTMVQIRSEVLKLGDAERLAVSAALASADRLRIVSRSLIAAAALLNLVLLVIAGGLLARHARRRAEFTLQKTTENEELEQRVRQRTAELSTLSSHLQQLSEKEKAALARELHDELGGLLIAAKMDIAWLQKRWPDSDPGVQQRFSRVLKMLDEGVDFKRRIVESLRPTLLDNMGLFPAMRWVTHETCARAGLHFAEHFPDQEPLLTDDAGITIFRIVQEALGNIVKHAKATEVTVSVEIADGNLLLSVEDNGQGIEFERGNALASHGFATMRHRVRSLGGELDIGLRPGGGARVRARLPLAAVQRTAIGELAPAVAIKA